ncbi:MAG: serine hydrolase [Terriglobia bacterium]|nr:serine hydrolase [Terriglobia bacterium]
MNRRDLLKATPLLLSAKARISFCTPATPTSYSHRLRGLSQYIGDVMARFHVPGAAVAIVLGDDTLFCQGFGVRDVTTRAPVEENTLFSLASNTKPFTGTCFAMLESEGRLKAQDRVVDYLPFFGLSSLEATQEMKIGDLLSHKSGLPAHAGDLLFFPPTTYTLAEVVDRIRALPEVAPFGSKFAYENVLYAAGALLIKKVSGQPYTDFVSERIFAPLGMTSSRVNAEGLNASGNVATGYRELDSMLRPVPPLIWNNNPGAGGIYSSATDMLSWMRLHLNGGLCHTPSGTVRRLYTKVAQERMWRPQVQIPLDSSATPADKLQYGQLSYGSGWFLSNYRGERLVWHTGEFPGFTSKMTLVPSRKFGVAVLTNQEQDEAFEAITNYVLDRFLGMSDIDWLTLFTESAESDRQQTQAKLAALLATRTFGQDRVVDHKRYEGTFEDPWYGDVLFRSSEHRLLVQFEKTPSLHGELHPWCENTFKVRWDDRLLQGDALIEFHLDSSGTAKSAGMKRLSPFEAPAFDFRDLRLVRKEASGIAAKTFR